MKKWRFSCGSLKEFEVIKETEKQVVFITSYGKEVRELKCSNWASWHDTKEDAINHEICQLITERNSKQALIDSINRRIGALQALLTE